jgi:hypothetical protein
MRAETLQEKKKVESERLAQFRHNHKMNSTDGAPDVDINIRVKETERDARRTRLRITQLKKELEQSRNNQEKSQTNWYNGEWGPESYEPWQMEDYYMVHSIVLDIVNRAVRDATAIMWSEAIDLDTQELLWETEKKKLELDMKMHQVMRESQFAAASITDMVIESECTTIARDFIKLCRSSDKFVNSLLITAIQGICATNNDHLSLVKSSHMEMKNTRKKTLDIHRHTQMPFVRVNKDKTATTQEITEFDTDEDDVIVLDFLHLQPTHLSHSELSDDELQYKHTEAMYWQNLEPTFSLFSLPNVVKGILSTAVDPSEKFIALGSDNGIIVVMDLCYHPPLTVRLHLPTKSADKVPIQELTWSLDSSRLLSLNSKGVVQLWSMSGHYSHNIKKEASDFSHSSASGYFPCQLKNLMSLTSQDFVFIEGPFAGSKQNNTPTPVIAVFHPAVTLLGTQNWLVVGFSDGDILKVNCDDSLINIRHSTVNTETALSRIRQNLLAELFRGHRYSISSIGFVRHTAQMVSVDIESHVFIWNYDRSSQTGFGWFIPARKFRVDMAERVYKPAYGHSVKTIFSDSKQLAGHRKQTVQQRERSRRLAKQMIESLPEPPWHTKQDKDFVIKIYSPEDVSVVGEIFHIVTLHHSDGELSEYATQMYKPAKNVATQLISAKITPSGQDVIFMFCYPEFSPKLPHITVVMLSVESFVFHSVRIDVPLTQQQYDDCVANPACSMAVSRVFDISRSDYITLNISGKLLGYSLATGSLLLSGGHEDHFMSGCELKGRMSTIPRYSVIQIAHQTTCVKLVISNRGSSTLHIFQLDDGNTRVSKQRLWQASNQGMLRILRNCPPAFRARSHHWTINGSCFVSPEDFARNLVDEMVSLAVTCSKRPATEDTENRNSQLNDDTSGYVDAAGNDAASQSDALSGVEEADGISRRTGDGEGRVEGEMTPQLADDGGRAEGEMTPQLAGDGGSIHGN